MINTYSHYTLVKRKLQTQNEFQNLLNEKKFTSLITQTHLNLNSNFNISGYSKKLTILTVLLMHVLQYLFFLTYNTTNYHVYKNHKSKTYR